MNNPIHRLNRNLSADQVFLYFGHIGFMILFFLSILFFKERILFNDSVFQFFKIVNFEKINIEASRYSTFLTQIPLLLALKTTIGLKGLALIYSVSFIALYYLVFLICTHWFRNAAVGVAILFSLVISITQSFYHPVTETHQAIVYSLLAYGILQHDFRYKRKFIQYMLSGAALGLAFYSHPVGLFTGLFVLFYQLVEQKKWNLTGHYLLVTMLLLLAFLKFFTIREESYEGGFFTQLMDFNGSPENWKNLYSLQFFVYRLNGLYLGLMLLFLAFGVIAIRQKEYIKTIFVAASTLGFFLITLVTYATGDADFMMERSFMPLTVFIVLPFFTTIQRKMIPKNTLILTVLMLLVFLPGIVRITKEGFRNRERLDYVHGLFMDPSVEHSAKILLKKNEANTQKIIYTWPLAFTTLVSSSMDNSGHSRTIYMYDDIEGFEKYRSQETNVFLGAPFWLEWPYSALNDRFFNLPQAPYVILKE
jgi:hypothetical protein